MDSYRELSADVSGEYEALKDNVHRFAREVLRPAAIAGEAEINHAIATLVQAFSLMNPPILNDPINGSERGEFEQHSGEAFDQWPQAGLWHHWYEVVEHGTLTKQGVGTLF